MIKLDIFSDPVCPWCYIGKANLDRALEQRPDHPFAIEWHPFQLNPGLPAGGMDYRDYLEHKFGGREGVLAAHKPVIEHAEAAGLTLNLPAIKRMPNTLDAHRLIHWAGIEGRQTPVVAALFRAHFKEGLDIGNPKVLADIGARFDMDRDAVERLLASDADSQLIRERVAHARERGVSAVPTFILGNRHAVPGAQPSDLWLRVLDDLEQAGEA